ncbi:MAG: ankyrin repeat domain-containing protein, partial [bacterium]
QANNGFTPLHFAAQGHFGNEQAINLLLKKGADPRIQDSNGRTADTYSKNYKIINILTGQSKPATEKNFDPFKDIDPIEIMPEFKNPKELKDFLNFLETDDPIIFEALLNYLKSNKPELFQKIQDF